METYYLTKDCLTTGAIDEVVGREVNIQGVDYILVGQRAPELYRLGVDIFDDLAKARVRAHKVRKAKIASLTRQLEKLDLMIF